MKPVLIGLGLVFALVATVVAVGAALPRDHTAASRARYAAGADQVWSAISDIDGAAGWRDGVERTERVADEGGAEVWREHSRYGAMTYRVERHAAQRRLVMTLAGEGAFGGSWTYLVEDAGAGSELTITEAGSVYNPVFRFVSRFLTGHHGTMDAFLVDLGRHLGEDVHPEHVPPGPAAGPPEARLP